MNDDEIAHATVLRNMEDELERSRLDVIKSIEDLFSYIERKKQEKQQHREHIMSYINYSLLIIWLMSMGVILLLSI